MSVATITRIGFILAGAFVMGRTFWLYAKKRLTVDIAMAWEAAGAGVLIVGIVPAFSRWCRLLSGGTATALLLGGMVIIWAGLRFSVLLSVLQFKTQELAVQVSLLKEENRRLTAEMGPCTGKRKAEESGDEE